MHAQVVDQVFHERGQEIIGNLGIAPPGVAAIRRNHAAIQSADGGRARQKGRISMPAIAEYAVYNRAGFLQQALYIWMAWNAVGIGVGAEWSKALGKRFLVLKRDVLVAEINHLVTKQRGFHLRELRIGYRGDIDPLNF